MLQTLNFYSDSRFHIGSKGSAGAPSPRRHSPRHFLSFYRLLTSHALAFGLGRLAICLVVGQQQLPQDVQIASQNPQTHVTLIARFVAIPTTLQPVARLQRADCRLDSGMSLSRLAKCHCPLLLLLTPLLLPFRHDTRRPHDRRQVLLILRRVKGPVKRGALDLAPKTLLQLPHDRHYHVLIQC